MIVDILMGTGFKILQREVEEEGVDRVSIWRNGCRMSWSYPMRMSRGES